MATDVNELSGLAGSWKTKVVVGLLVFLIGFLGLSNAWPLGLDMPTRWTTSTVLVLVGLAVTMYGLANITG